MAYTNALSKRLQFEDDLLNEYFPNNVKWINRNADDTKVEIQMKTNSNKRYTLQVRIPQDYPNSCPDLRVSNPARPLKDSNGSEMTCGTDNHSYGTEDGITTICHFVPGQWTNEYTLYQVFMKGRIWLEAYEIHLRTGKPISDYLREMTDNPVQEWEATLQRRGEEESSNSNCDSQSDDNSCIVL